MTIVQFAILVDALFATILLIIPVVSSVGVPQKKSQGRTSAGKVLQNATGEPIVGAQVMVYRADGKLLTTLTTNEQGEFSSSFPAGEYGVTVYAPGYELAASCSPEVAELGMPYVGGTFTVESSNTSLPLIIPVVPVSGAASTVTEKVQLLWRSTLFMYRKLFWIAWSVGIVANSFILIVAPSIVVGSLELLYGVVVAIHLFFQSRVSPSIPGKAVVRDRETQNPIDLAVIRLFDEATAQLVATQISDGAGRFMLVPSPGTYRIEVAHDGYETVSRAGLVVTADDNSALEAPIDMQKTAVI